MIKGEFSVIRTAEPDDARGLRGIYNPQRPRAALLDRKRELLVPTVDELQEILGRKELKAGVLYAIENTAGDIRGLCSLRGVHPTAFFAECLLLFDHEEDYGTGLADEAFDFLRESAFLDKRLRKLTAHCLPSEVAFRDFLVRKGFEHVGFQREVYFTKGAWNDIEVFVLFAGESHGNAGEPNE